MSENTIVETQSKPEIGSKTSFEPSNVEVVNIPDEAPAPIESEPTETNNVVKAGGDGELPDFVKRRLGKEQKKHERELARLRTELEETRSRVTAPQPQQFNAQQNGYIDPITNEYIDVSTPEGQAIYNYQQKMSTALTAQEKRELDRQQKEIEYKLHEHFASSFDDAAAKYPEFEKTMMNSGMQPPLARALGEFPDPGELGYYIASNPQEFNRLQRLPPYEMKRELARHLADMVQKNNITRAPTPVKPITGGAANPAKHHAHKTLAELKAERRAQLTPRRK